MAQPYDSPWQPSLLSTADLRAAEMSWAYGQASSAEGLSAQALQDWKQRVYRFQQELGQGAGPTQGSLFGTGVGAEPGSPAEVVGQLDPFGLPQRNGEFWREQFSDRGAPALYFVVDHELPILLYVGETVRANQRWKGTHDCKRYILNYVAAHRLHSLPVQVNIGFWPYAPEDRRARQALELALIRHWRSPFNKENWQQWGTPFTGGKS